MTVVAATDRPDPAPWRAPAALLATLVIFFVSAWVPPFVLSDMAPGWFITPASGWWYPPVQVKVGLIEQGIIVLMVLTAAGGVDRRLDVLVERLGLAGRAGASSLYFTTGLLFVGMVIVSFVVREAASATGVGLTSPGPPAGVLFAQSAWVEFLAAAVGAPLAEELLFRGFLFPPLARSWLGPAGGAIVSSGLWTSVHPTLPWFSLLTVFLIGLLHAWARWRTDSLWPCIIAHALFNGTLVGAVIAFR
jgi:membrane protease YdiL (CAAX protease family)